MSHSTLIDPINLDSALVERAEQHVEIAKAKIADAEARFDEDYERRKQEALAPHLADLDAAERFVSLLRREMPASDTAVPTGGARRVDEETVGSASSDSATSPAVDPANSSKRIYRKFWPAVAQKIGHSTVSTADVVKMVLDVGEEATPKQVRKQLGSWANSGHMERLSDGIFRFTPKGLQKYGLPAREQAPSNVRALHTG